MKEGGVRELPREGEVLGSRETNARLLQTLRNTILMLQPYANEIRELAIALLGLAC